MKDYMIIKDHSLQRFHTFRLEVMAHTILLPITKKGLVQALKDFADKKIVIIGKGSNLIFKQSYYDDNYVFIVTILLDKIEIRNAELYVQAGASMHKVAWYCCEHSISDYAYLEDIPGTIGGGLMMNAGQWQYTLGKTTHWIEIFNKDSQQVEIIYPDETFFSYRYSALKDMNAVILSCGLKIEMGEYETILNQMLEYRRERYVKQPRQYANAGSTFKRPKDKEGNWLFIWKLFDAVNLRGKRFGDVEISQKHPGFIVNVHNAKIDDVFAAINECKVRVKEAFDVDIELEWIVI